MSEGKLVNLFFSHIQSCRFLFPDGSEAAFIGGRYATDDKDKIAYLNSEIDKGHPHLYVKSDQLQVDPIELDPAEALKKKIIEEAIAAGLVQRTTTSTSEQAPLKPSSSADLVDVKTPEQLLLEQGIKVVDAPVTAAETTGIKINLSK